MATSDLNEIYPGGVYNKQRGGVPGLPVSWGGTKWPLPPKFPVPQDWWGGSACCNKVPGHTEGGETEEAAIYNIMSHRRIHRMVCQMIILMIGPIRPLGHHHVIGPPHFRRGMMSDLHMKFRKIRHRDYQMIGHPIFPILQVGHHLMIGICMKLVMIHHLV